MKTIAFNQERPDPLLDLLGCLAARSSWRKVLHLSLVAFLSIACLSLRLSAAEVYRGIQAIGFANWERQSVTNLVKIFKDAGGNLEITLLHPDVFSGNRDNWTNLNIFLDECYPTGQTSSIKKLRVTVYFGFHGQVDALAKDENVHGPVWNALSHNPLRGNDRQALEQWDKRRTRSYFDWLNAALSAHPEIREQISLVVSPLLEDKESKISLEKLQQRIKSKLRPMLKNAHIDPGLVEYRRSPAGTDSSCVGQYLEIHGAITASSQTQLLKRKRGDAFSNDGNLVWVDTDAVPTSQETSATLLKYNMNGAPTRLSTFILTGKSLARNHGVSLLLWRPAYNGMPQYSKSTSLPKRKDIDAGLRDGELEKAALLHFLQEVQ